MQRPSVAPTVKRRRDLNVIEGRRHIRNNPEDQEQPHPRHTHNHCCVLTGQAQRDHAEEIQHPVYQECAMTICDRVSVRNVCDLGLASDRVVVREIDLEGHGDERVGKG